MTTITQYQKVREFMQAFGQETPERPGIPPYNIRWLRSQLIDEESTELINARDGVEAFDAILDLIYVVLGSAIANGFTEEQIARGFAEVHRSNMTKFWTKDEVGEYVLLNIGGDKPDLVFTELPDGKFRAHDPSGKIIKSPSYSPANLRPILEGTV